MNSAKVSFVVPVYNASRFIDKCLTSIMEQTNQDFEIVIVDDGSTDDSRDYIQKWAVKYPDKIVPIFQENQGAGKARDRGVLEASGEWIAFMDNDDFLENDYVETFVNATEDGDWDLVLGGYRRVTDEKELFSVSPQTEWAKYMITAPWARLYRRQYIVDHGVHFFEEGWAEDLYFNSQFYFCGAKIKTISYIGYNWWFNYDSVSNTNRRVPDQREDAIVFTSAVANLPRLIKSEYYELFQLRYLSWYLLWALKYEKPDVFAIKYKRFFDWLRNQQIPRKFPLFSDKVKEETFKTRLGINVLIWCDKLHAWTLFAKLWAKG